MNERATVISGETTRSRSTLRRDAKGGGLISVALKQPGLAAIGVAHTPERLSESTTAPRYNAQRAWRRLMRE